MGRWGDLNYILIIPALFFGFSSSFWVVYTFLVCFLLCFFAFRGGWDNGLLIVAFSREETSKLMGFF